MSENSHRLLEVKNLKKYFPLRTGRFGSGTETVKAVDDVYKVGDHALLLTRLNSVRNLSFSYKGAQMADGANKLYGDDFKLRSFFIAYHLPGDYV